MVQAVLNKYTHRFIANIFFTIREKATFFYLIRQENVASNMKSLVNLDTTFNPRFHRNPCQNQLVPNLTLPLAQKAQSSQDTVLQPYQVSSHPCV